jgi:hypothetical protein
MKSNTVWDVTWCNPTFQRLLLPLYADLYLLVYFLDYSSTVKIDRVCPSETSVRYPTTWRHVSEGTGIF